MKKEEFIIPKIKENTKYYLLLAVVCQELFTGLRMVTDSEVKAAIQQFEQNVVKRVLKKHDILKLKYYTLNMRRKYKQCDSDGIEKWNKFYCEGEKLVFVF